MLLDPITGSLDRYMTLLSERQSLVSSNIANADTPGYKTKDIDFESAFRNAMSGMPPEAEEVSGLTLKDDGNNVSLERESRLLAENQMRFSIASNFLRSQLRLTRMAIEGNSTQS
ncbi:MAG: flagellar basal body rod protein FlgB [Bryobacteraceae bacterium]